METNAIARPFAQSHQGVTEAQWRREKGGKGKGRKMKREAGKLAWNKLRLQTVHIALQRRTKADPRVRARLRRAEA